jgi:hypothetical protein
VTYQLTVINDCEYSSFVTHIISDVIVVINKPATIQSLFVDDAKALLDGNSVYCGARTYSIAPLQTFMNLVGDDLVASSTDPNEVGFYDVALTVGLQDFPMVPAFQTTFVLKIACEVTSTTVV